MTVGAADGRRQSHVADVAEPDPPTLGVNGCVPSVVLDRMRSHLLSII